MEQSLDFIRSDSWKAARLRGALLSKRHSQPLELIKELTGQSWGPDDSAQVYNVEGWGAPYFSVTDRGTLFVRPTGLCAEGAAGYRHHISMSQWGGIVVGKGWGLVAFVLAAMLNTDQQWLTRPAAQLTTQ